MKLECNTLGWVGRISLSLVMPSAFAFDASEHHIVAYQVLIFALMAISRPP